eukprot:jgi/Psemu1/7205/gm1.7205_g
MAPSRRGSKRQPKLPSDLAALATKKSRKSPPPSPGSPRLVSQQSDDLSSDAIPKVLATVSNDNSNAAQKLIAKVGPEKMDQGLCFDTKCDDSSPHGSRKYVTVMKQFLDDLIDTLALQLQHNKKGKLLVDDKPHSACTSTSTSKNEDGLVCNPEDDSNGEGEEDDK